MKPFQVTSKTLAESFSEAQEDATLKEVPVASALQSETGSFGKTQENEVRVCDDGAIEGGGVVSVVTTRIVETEISVQRSYDRVVDDGRVKSGASPSLKNQENVKEVQVENGDGSKDVKGLVFVMGVDKNGGDGVEKNGGEGAENLTPSGDSSLLIVNSSGKKAGSSAKMESTMSKIDVKEGKDLDRKFGNGDDRTSSPKNEGDSDSSMHNIIEEKDGEGDDVGDYEYEYSVGEFVWGKIKHHPWWPGQIYDHSDASDYALKYKQNDRYLVAYFGDGTFAWCYPSQLKPFEENFEHLSKQSNSKKFVNAVQGVLDEVGRLVESKLTCTCVPNEIQIDLARPMAGNAGVKEGVFVPEGSFGKSSKILQFEPAQLHAELKFIAQVVSLSGVLELNVFKSKLSAFYRAKGGYQLPMYHLPRYVAGLEDKTRNGITNNGESDEQVDVPTQVPIEEDLLASPRPPRLDKMRQSSLRNGPSISEDKLYQRRKQKSIAEIMSGEDVEPKNQSTDLAIEGTHTSKSGSTSRGRKKKVSDEAETHNGSKRRKKLKLLGAPASTDEEDSGDDSGDGRSEKTTKKGSKSRERKENKNSSVENDGNTIEKDTEKEGFSPRERKKSKYLSPPYMNPGRRSFKGEAEPEILTASSSPRVGERMNRAADQIFSKCSNQTQTHEKKLVETEPSNGHDISGSSSPETPKHDHKKMVIDPIVTKANADELLSEIRYAASDPLYLRKGPKSVDNIRTFFSTFRSSIYRNGSNYKLFNKRRPGRKRKSIDHPEPASDSLAKDPNQTKIKKNEAKSDQPKLKQASERSDMQKTEKGSEGKGSSPAALFLTYGEGVILPSKDELIARYSKFGPVNKLDTDVLHKSSFAQVVFVRGSDAEQALKHSMSVKADNSINYRLRYLTPGSKIRELEETPRTEGTSSMSKDGGKEASESSSPLQMIREKLEMMTSMVDKSDGNMTKEIKNNLEGELKSLLEKVSSMG